MVLDRLERFSYHQSKWTVAPLYIFCWATVPPLMKVNYKLTLTWHDSSLVMDILILHVYIHSFFPFISSHFLWGLSWYQNPVYQEVSPPWVVWLVLWAITDKRCYAWLTLVKIPLLLTSIFSKKLSTVVFIVLLYKNFWWIQTSVKP